MALKWSVRADANIHPGDAFVFIDNGAVDGRPTLEEGWASVGIALRA